MRIVEYAPNVENKPLSFILHIKTDISVYRFPTPSVICSCNIYVPILDN